jgi:hypothetical protein
LLNEDEQRAEIESLVFSCAGVLAHLSDRPIDFVPQAIARRPKPPINSRGLSFEEPQLSTTSIIVLLGRAPVTETSMFKIGKKIFDYLLARFYAFSKVASAGHCSE